MIVSVSNSLNGCFDYMRVQCFVPFIITLTLPVNVPLHVICMCMHAC